MENFMAKPLSVDLRKRIVTAYLNKEGTYAQVAQRFSVSPSAVQDFVRLYRTTGSLEPQPHSGGNPTQKLFEHHWLHIQQWLKDESDLMWPEVADKVKEHFDIVIDPSQLSRISKRRGWTRKKTPSATPKSTTLKSKLNESDGDKI